MDIRQARREYKFRLGGEQVLGALEEIRDRLPGDANGACGAYPIVSEYYDTAGRDAWWERDRKVGNRRRLRVRIYGLSNGAIPPAAFLEVKHKQDGVGVKRRISVPVEEVTKAQFDMGDLIRERRPQMTLRRDLALAEEILRLVGEGGVVPTMQMRYERQAFEMSGVRITFDGGIKCRLGRLPLRPDDRDFPLDVLAPDERIMEVKLLGSAPYWLREIVARHRLSRTPFSKYGAALERYDPVLGRVMGRLVRRP